MTDIIIPTELDEKTVPLGADITFIADSADANRLKQVLLSSLIGPFITVGPALSYAHYVCDGVADNVQIQDAIDYLYGLGGGTLVTRDGIFDIQGTINIKDNVRVICGYATIFRRNTSFIGGGVKNIVELSGTNAQMYYGVVDGNSVAEPVGGDHSHDVSISGIGCVLDSVRAIGAGDGIDSSIGIIGTSGSPITDAIVRNCIAERNTDGHFFQTTYAEFMIQGCHAIGGGSSTVQDGFRTYTDSKGIISNCYARETRVGFQSWPTGNRDVSFVDCHADSCFQHGFLAQSTGTLISGCSSMDCLGRGLFMDGSNCTVTGFISNRNACSSSYCTTEITAIGLTTANGGDVFIEGNYNSITGVTGEGTSSSATWYGCIVQGDQNVVNTCAIYNSGFRRVYLYGDSNKVLVPVTQTVTDVGVSNYVI